MIGSLRLRKGHYRHTSSLVSNRFVLSSEVQSLKCHREHIENPQKSDRELTGKSSTEAPQITSPMEHQMGSRTFVYQTFLYQTHVYQTLVYLRHMSTKTLLYQDTCLPWTLLYHRHISTKTFVYPDSSLPWTFVYLRHLSTRHISTQ